jgi:hypothetical protein
MSAFSMRSAAVLGGSVVALPNAAEIHQISPALKPAAPEDGRMCLACWPHP